MRRYAFVLVLMLAACAGQTPEDRAALLEQSLTAAETGFLGYIRLPDCDANPPPCSQDSEVARVGAIDQKAFDAVQAYRDGVIAGQPDSVLQELLIAAQAAINSLSTATATLPKAQ